MTTIPILEVISFSTEHHINKVQNLVKNSGKWTNQTKNVSLRGKEIYEIQAEFKLPKCKIEAIDLGNCWSATIEIRLGRSGESISSRVPMFKTNPLILMTKLDCRNGGANAEMMSFLTKPDLNPQVLDQHWDRLHVVCKQQHKNDVYFGLSTIVIRGKRLDQISLGVPKKFNFKEVFKENEVKRQPDYYVQGSRASKLIEKSKKRTAMEPQIVEMTVPKNQRNPDFVSPQRKKMREEDDLKLNLCSKDRNQVFLQDLGNIDRKTKFNFKSDQKAENKTNSSMLKKSDEKPKNSKKRIRIESKFDLLKYCSEDLKDSGILVQHRSYKKSKELPLVNAELKVEAGQRVTFFKFGQTIVLATKGQIYDPKVKAEHISSIFKDYTETQIKASDKYQIVKTTTPENQRNPEFLSPQRKKMREEDDLKLNLCSKDRNQVLLQDPGNIDRKPKFNFKSDKKAENKTKVDDKKCPLCMKNFGQDENQLIEHASRCSGIEDPDPDPKTSTCPICQREFPEDSLASHAQECAHQFFD